MRSTTSATARPRCRACRRRARAQRLARTRARTGERRAPAQGSEALAAYCVDLNQKAHEGQDRSADRPRARGRAHHPGAVPPHQEQPALCRRARRRQDGDRRGPGAQDHRGRSARGAEGSDHLRARHGRAAGRHALSRRLRGAAEGRADRAGEAARTRSCSSTRSTRSSARAPPRAARWMRRTC